jgi:hypothetical protein
MGAFQRPALRLARAHTLVHEVTHS